MAGVVGPVATPALPRRRLGRSALFAFGATVAGAAALTAGCGDDDGGGGDDAGAVDGAMMMGGDMGMPMALYGPSPVPEDAGGPAPAYGAVPFDAGGEMALYGAPPPSAADAGMAALYGAVPADGG